LVPSDIPKSLNLPITDEREVISPSGEPVRVGLVQLGDIVVGTVRIAGVRAVSVVSGNDGTPGVVGCDLLLRFKVYAAVGKSLLGLIPRKGAL